MDLVSSAPYASLLLISFLASTLLPLGSEWLLVALLLQGYPPAPLIGLATVGNLLGAFTTYLIGRSGGNWLLRHLLRIDPVRRRRAEVIYRRWGSWSLLMAWLPVIGDPLCLVGGLLRTGILPFLFLAGTGKFLRYLLLALAVLPATAT